jgi:hypothetical protein
LYSNELVTCTNQNVAISTTVVVNGGTIIYSGSFSAPSDQRLKKNITFITAAEGRAAVRGLRGVYFDWDARHAYGRHLLSHRLAQAGNASSFPELPSRRVGFVAQEVQAVLPLVVHSLWASEREREATAVGLGDEEMEKESGEGLLGVAYQDVLPYVVMGMRDADDRLAALALALARRRGREKEERGVAATRAIQDTNNHNTTQPQSQPQPQTAKATRATLLSALQGLQALLQRAEAQQAVLALAAQAPSPLFFAPV